MSFKSNVVRGADNSRLSAAVVDRNEEYDVGLLRLADSATTLYPEIKPADLPGEGALEKYRRGDLFTHVGYGLDRYASRRELISNPPNEYKRRTLEDAPLSRLTDAQLFTRSRDGNLCKGDSGGPVFNDDGVIVALGNYVSGNCKGTNSGPRLDIEPVQDFLTDNGVLPVPN